MSCNYDSDCEYNDCGWWGCCTQESDVLRNVQSGDAILIDLRGAGFPLTSVQDGVSFDFHGNNRPLQIAWTARDADAGFLVLDRNHSGRIESGAKLFSSVSPQPGGREGRSGFLALAVFDQPANGGTHDGWITARDAVYSQLRIWVDKNHNGKADPGELLTLAQAGVKAISVNPTSSTWTDVYGNRFQSKGHIVWQKPVNGRTSAAIYDVVLAGGR